jgi:hypothetical protein
MVGGTLVAAFSGLTAMTCGSEHEATVAGGAGEQRMTLLLLPPAAITKTLIEAEMARG